MTEIARDLRHGFRSLANTPAWTAVALATLALGIGANSAIFSVVDTVLLRPLPYEEAHELIFVHESTPQLGNMSVSYPNFQDFQDRNASLDGLGAYNYLSLNWTGAERPQVLRGARVSAGLFPSLGVDPARGRGFLPEEDRVGGRRVALLSHSFWRERLGSDPAAVGSTLRLNDEPFQVVGVMPEGFRFPPFQAQVDLWVPIEQWAEQWLESRGSHPGIYLVGRRADGASLEEARGDLERIAAALGQEYPDTNADNGVVVTDLHEEVVEEARPALLVLSAAVALVLLIACANVANLLLVRATARNRDLAVRTALGAGRWRLVRQVVAESLILAAGGGALGLLVAAWGRAGLVALVGDEVPRLAQAGLDLRVLGFTAALALGTALLFGPGPALLATRGELAPALKEGARGGVGSGRHRARSLLVVAEVALALVLLVGAGLLLRSLDELLSASPGLDVDGVLTASVSLPESRYPDGGDQHAFLERLLERAGALPGVESATAVMPLPLGGDGWQTSYHVEGTPPPEPGAGLLTDFARVSPGYFRTLGIPLLRGRGFTEADRDGAVPVVVVDETFAEIAWPGDDPLGKRLKLNGYDSDEPYLEVVGVAGHVKNYGVDRDSRRQLYIPFAQNRMCFFTVALRTSGEPGTLAGPLRQAVAEVDPDQPLASVRTLASYRAEGAFEQRLLSTLLGVFAAVALGLAAVGLFGVLAASVAERTHEIGLRMALGAGGGEVLRLVVARGMALTGIGLAAGFAGSAGVVRLLGGVLYGVGPADPATFALVPVILAAVALAACWLPARRAAAVDPMVTLRSE